MGPRPLLTVLLVLVLAGGCAAPREQVRRPSAAPLGIRVVETARAQIGVPYRYGGAGPAAGFDCSGLVWWVYRQHGVDLPRTTRDQIRSGRPVPLGGLAPGDILCFRTSRSGRLHVGIYTGQGTMVHSPKTGSGVREEPVLGRYWTERFVTARRVLPP